MTKYLLDTNVLLRFLLGDHPQLSPIAADLFQDATDGNCILVLNDVAIAEAVWVLMSHYRIDRQSTADKLSKVITSAGVKCEHVTQMLDALKRLGTTNCDFFDCYLAATATHSGFQVASFDQDFRKFPDVELWNNGKGWEEVSS